MNSKFINENDRYVYFLAVNEDLADEDCRVLQGEDAEEAHLYFFFRSTPLPHSQVYRDMTGKEWIGVQFDFLRRQRAAIVVEDPYGYVMVHYFAGEQAAEKEWLKWTGPAEVPDGQDKTGGRKNP